MKTKLSVRREKFYRLVSQAHYQESEWLERIVNDKRVSILSRTACRRILVCRIENGRPYRERVELFKAANLLR